MTKEDLKHFRECRIRHYQNMSKARAMKVMAELSSKKMKSEFKKRINACKKEEFIK